MTAATPVVLCPALRPPHVHPTSTAALHRRSEPLNRDPAGSVKMPVWCSGLVVCLLAVCCVTADPNSTVHAEQEEEQGLNITVLVKPKKKQGPSSTVHAKQDVPRDCSGLPNQSDSGNYSIQPNPSGRTVQAYCEKDNGGGKMWTVFQRRVGPLPDFNRNWADYKWGFGHPAGGHWLGLEYLSVLTAGQNRRYQLWIDLEAFDGDKGYRIYNSFWIAPEQDGYRLNVSIDDAYGTIGDSLEFNNNQRFSTKDRENDYSYIVCTDTHQGGYWFGACTSSNLNGRYLKEGSDDMHGIWWQEFKGKKTLKKTAMKIRPA